jgi:hypothetical protein
MSDQLRKAAQRDDSDNKKPKQLAVERERNFCERCGKRLGGANHIHTCTPPDDEHDELFCWKVLGVSGEYTGYMAEEEAHAVAKRIGGTCFAFPLYVKPQPANESVLQNTEQYRMQMACICTAAIGYWREDDPIHPDHDTVALRDVAKLYAKYEALYTAPARPLNWQEIQCPCCGDLARAFPPAPAREWVGLTDDEIFEIHKQVDSMQYLTFGKAIEAKLKEKNI